MKTRNRVCLCTSALVGSLLVPAASMGQADKGVTDQVTTVNSVTNVLKGVDSWGGVAGPCDVVCPKGATLEDEPNCGLDGAGNPDDFTNGGCNSDPPVFGSISCGETVCGSGGSSAGFRDTDWYTLVLTADTEITINVEAEFPVVSGLVENCGVDDCDATTGFLNPFGTADPCVPLAITTCLPAGTYYVFVAPLVANIPCPSDYVLSVDCTDCIPERGACCLPTGECVPDQTQCQCEFAPPGGLGGIWLGPDSVCEDKTCAPPDNDVCEDAESLDIPGSVIANTAFADNDETPFCGTSSAINGVWYVVEGTGNTITATTCSDNTDFDTKIQVYCDCCDLVCVAGNDDAGAACAINGLHSQVTWCSAVGQLYYIKVGGFSGSGTFELTVTDDATPCDTPASCDPPLGRCCFNCPWDVDNDGDVDVDDLVALILGWAPQGCEVCTGDVDNDGDVDVNDLVALILNWAPQGCDPDPLCQETTLCRCTELNGIWGEGELCDDLPCPVEISAETCDEAFCIEGFPFRILFNNDTATADGPPGSCNIGSATVMQNDVWFKVTVKEDCFMLVDSDPMAYDGIVQVYSGTCESLTEVICLDEVGVPKSDIFNAIAGTTYYFQCGDWGTGEGGGDTLFNLDCVTELPTGACCAGDGSCQVLTEGECDDAGGNYLGDDVPCTPDNPCPQPPANDDCDDAIKVSPGETIFGSNALANDDATPFCGTSSGFNEVWYVVQGTGTTITVDTCGEGTDYDTKLQVFCDCEELVCVAGIDDFCGLQSQVSWCSSVDQSYVIAVSGFGTSTGNFELAITEDGLACDPPVNCIPPEGACCVFTDCTIETQSACLNLGGEYQGDDTLCDPNPCGGACCVDGECQFETEDDCFSLGGDYFGDGTDCSDPDQCNPPENDDCATRADLGTGGTPIAVAWNNTLATNDPDGIPHSAACNKFGDSPGILRDVWFTWTADADRTVQIDTCGGGLDSKMIVYGACPTGDDQEIACDDDDGGALGCPDIAESAVQVTVTSGQTLIIRVGSWGTDAGGQGPAGPSVLNITNVP